MMHTMARRRIEDPFERAEAWDPRDMQPELPQQIERKQCQHDLGRHTEKRCNQKERQRTREAASPAEPVCGRKIELIRRMVHGVCAPEPAHPMRRAVIPVVAEFLADEAGQPTTPMTDRHSPESVLPDPVHGVAPERERQQPAQRILANEKIGDRHCGCFPVVALSTVPESKNQRLCHRGDENHSISVFQQRKQSSHNRTVGSMMSCSVDRNPMRRNSSGSRCHRLIGE